MSQPPLKAHLALLTVALIYGLNYSIAKDVMPQYAEPRGFILLRALGATLLFQLVGLFLPREKIARSDWWRLILGGFFGVAANQLLFFEGLNLTGPIPASVIMTSNPILVLLFSALFLGTPLRWVRILGIVLGLTGALYLILGKADQQALLAGGARTGNLLVFLNAASFGAYLIVAKPLLARYHALSVTRWVFLFGLLFVLPFGGKQFAAIAWQELPWPIVAEMAYVVLATTFLAYLLNMYALKQLSSTTVSFYIYLQPLFATLGALLWGMAAWDWRLPISAALLFSGIYLVSFAPGRR